MAAAQCPRCAACTVSFLYIYNVATAPCSGPCYATFVTVYRGTVSRDQPGWKYIWLRERAFGRELTSLPGWRAHTPSVHGSRPPRTINRRFDTRDLAGTRDDVFYPARLRFVFRYQNFRHCITPRTLRRATDTCYLEMLVFCFEAYSQVFVGWNLRYFSERN